MPFCCWYIAWTNDPSAFVGLIKICRALVQSVGRNHKIPDIFRKLLHNILHQQKKKNIPQGSNPAVLTYTGYIHQHAQTENDEYFLL